MSVFDRFYQIAAVPGACQLRQLCPRHRTFEDLITSPKAKRDE